ncbi:MAG: histidine phosphatase family protein [Leptospira sp.]|nr:histidine phosphatase family protein [Leptospira sp.]NCS93380.1 histidine phosphatase family protein [Leptospira sp.]
MARIYLVRHGQANSLGAEYDQLTELGHSQAKLLGEYFVRMRIEFDFVASGTLRRQKQTLEGMLAPLGREGFCFPPAEEFEELNEFDPGLWLHIANKIRKEDAEFAKTLERYKALQSAGRPSSREIFYKLIQRVLREWVEGIHDEPYSFDQYKNKVASTLTKIPQDAGSILLATSSTPVAVLSGLSLGLAKTDFLPLMRYISNTSLNIFDWKDGQIAPISINSYPHIQDPDFMSLL